MDRDWIRNPSEKSKTIGGSSNQKLKAES